MASFRRLMVLCGASGVVALAIWQGCAVYDSSLLLDGGVDASDANVTPDVVVDGGDGCNHKVLPPRPAADDDASTDNVEVYMALQLLDFGTSDGGGAPLRVVGYDLDGLCTCPAIDSCSPYAEAGTQCDLEGGVDDSTGLLLQEFSGPTNFWDQTYLNNNIAAGNFGAMVHIQGWNGKGNDKQIEVSLFTSNGTPLTDAGIPSVPQFKGNDVWTIDPGAVLGGVIDPDAGPTPVSAYDLNAYVANYTVVANISDMPLAIGSADGQGLVTIELTGAHVVAHLTPFGTSGQFQATGTVAGRWQTRKLLTALQVLNDPFQADASLCGNDAVYQLLKPRICAHQDITTSPSNDNTGAPCDALSLAFNFTAVPARYGPVFAKPDAGGGCGPTYSDQCP